MTERYPVQKIRVLLVDDEEAFIAGFSRILLKRGFDVCTALNGFQAVDAIKYGGGFDVVVLDIKMPGMDGIETLREIKKRAPDTEVIMLTGHASIPLGAEAIRGGAYDFLIKPCDIEDIVAKIREAHEAEDIKRHPVLWARKTVGEIALHPAGTLRPNDPLLKALRMMTSESAEEQMEELYVLDSDGRLSGVVARKELLSEARRVNPGTDIDWEDVLRNPRLLPYGPADSVMRTDPLAAGPEDSLREVAEKMIFNKLRCMPVLDDGGIIGTIKLTDIFHYVDQETE